MLKHPTTALACLLTCLLSQPAWAQDGYCASSPVEMLVALDGGWQFEQGAGVAIGGGIPVPLPAHPPKAMTLTFDPSTATSLLSAADGELLMVPASAGQATEIVTAMTAGEGKSLLNIGAGCDWYALPLMIGSNTYVLSEGAPGEPKMAWGEAFGVAFFYCSTGLLGNSGAPGDYGKQTGGTKIGQMGEIDITPADWHPHEFFTNPTAKLACKPPPIPPAAEGLMVMSVAVAFQTPDRGTGMVHFTGQVNGQRFMAKAPVTMTRTQ